MVRSTILRLTKIKALAAVAAVAALPAFAAPVAISDIFSSFYSFGDSLSDDGKLAAINDVAFNSLGGRFSDGLVWAELIEDQFIAAGKTTGNFAIGGATANTDPTPTTLSDLDAQVALFKGLFEGGLTTPGSNPLISFWAGANDILAAIAGGSPDVLFVAGTAASAVANKINLITLFGGADFDDFLVVNLPDLGRIPLFNGTAAAPLATAATLEYNAFLASSVAGLRASGLNIYELDAFSLLNDALNDPSAFGYASATVPCIVGYIVDPTPVGCATFAPSELLFADSIHPNSVAHQNLAAAAEAAVLSAIPLPASASMILAGLAALGVVGLRRRRADAAPSPVPVA